MMARGIRLLQLAMDKGSTSLSDNAGFTSGAKGLGNTVSHDLVAHASSLTRLHDSTTNLVQVRAAQYE